MHAIKVFIQDFIALLRGQPLTCERPDYDHQEHSARSVVATLSRGNISLSQGRFLTTEALERERTQMGKLTFR